MIRATTLQKLSLILPNTNKALAKVLEDLSPQEFTSLTKTKDLKSILHSLLKHNAQDTAGNKQLLDLIKANPTLKSLGTPASSLKELAQLLQKENSSEIGKTLEHFFKNIQDISPKELHTAIKNSGIFLESKLKNFQPPLETLKNTLTEVVKQLESSQLPKIKEIQTQIKSILESTLFKNMTAEEPKQLATLVKTIKQPLQALEQRLHSSVDQTMHPKDIVFSKELHHNLTKLHHLNTPEQLKASTHHKELFSHDFKAVLLKTHEQVHTSDSPNKAEIIKHLDKLLLQVDYHQLLSHLSNASSLYIPYSWDALEDGEITLKNANNEKFFCDIELHLKEYGELKLRLGLFEKKQLNINITAQDTRLKSMLQEHISALKQQLSDTGLIVQSIRFLDDTQQHNTPYTRLDDEFDLGFEVKA